MDLGTLVVPFFPSQTVTFISPLYLDPHCKQNFLSLALPERSMLQNFRSMRHDRKSMQRRLSIEQNDIAIGHVSLNDIAEAKFIRNLMSVPVFEELFHLDGRAVDEVGSRMNIGTVNDQLLEVL